ncbi:MAG: hypothetical protein WBP79_00825, partial [Candidatus Acidiferrales bacterium]
LYVTLWIDDRSRARHLVTDHIRGVGEAIQIQLLEDQAAPPSLQVANTIPAGIRDSDFEFANRMIPLPSSQRIWRTAQLSRLRLIWKFESAALFASRAKGAGFADNPTRIVIL